MEFRDRGTTHQGVATMRSPRPGRNGWATYGSYQPALRTLLRVATHRSSMMLTFSRRNGEPKCSDMPSNESCGRMSFACSSSMGRGALLIPSPTFTGSDHGSLVVARVELQMSYPPFVPGRLDARNSSRPSRRTLASMSPDAELSSTTALPDQTSHPEAWSSHKCRNPRGQRGSSRSRALSAPSRHPRTTSPRSPHSPRS